MKKIFSLFIILLISCNEKEEEKIFVKTKIDSTRISHWGKGFFKNTLYYNFSYMKSDYRKSYKHNRLFRAGDYYYKKGDSIIIFFPKSKPKESVVLKKINN